MTRLTRRTVIVATGLLPLAPHLAFAETSIGRADAVDGTVSLKHRDNVIQLQSGDPLNEGDTVETGADGLALLMLNKDTKINIGSDSSVVLAQYLAEVGGTLQIGGAIVFDRSDDLAPIELTFETAYGQIGVRGTRFFAGPSKGSYAVFCQRGRVTVTNAGVTRDLGAGDGVNMAEGTAPTEVAKWGEARIVEAFASVGLTP